MTSPLFPTVLLAGNPRGGLSTQEEGQMVLFPFPLDIIPLLYGGQNKTFMAILEAHAQVGASGSLS